MLELVPQNCEVPARMDIITDQYKIENMGRIEATKKQQQQKVVRVFACNFYKLTKVYLIVGQGKDAQKIW